MEGKFQGDKGRIRQEKGGKETEKEMIEVWKKGEKYCPVLFFLYKAAQLQLKYVQSRQIDTMRNLPCRADQKMP